MDTDCAVSVIVPVYNAEKYIKRCVDSILCQTFSDFELLLIDDGSTDNSGKYCEQYKQLDRRVKVFHQDNSGVSAARNKGIQESKGKWLMFCDNDDKVSLDWIETLYNVAELYPERLVNCEYADIDMEGNCVSRHIDRYKEITLLEKSDYYILYEKGFSAYTWIRIFNAEIIKANKIRFDENLRYGGEDVIFVIDYLRTILGKMVYIPKTCYYWINNDGTSTSRSYNPNYYSLLEVLYWARKPMMDNENIIRFANHEYYRMTTICINDAFNRNDKKYYNSIINGAAFCDALKLSDYQHVSWKEKMIVKCKITPLIKKIYFRAEEKLVNKN